MSLHSAMLSILLSTTILAANAPTDTARLYLEAIERFRKGEVQGARLLWKALLVNRQDELGDGQVKAIKKWMSEAEKAVHQLDSLPDEVLLQKALTEYKEAAPLLSKRVNRQEARERISHALFYLKKARDKKRHSAKYNYLLGACLFYLGRYKESLPYVEGAIRIAPQKAQPINLRAEIKRLMGDFDGCLKDLAHSLRLSRNQPSIALRFARLLLVRNNSGDAEKAADLALSTIGDSSSHAEDLASTFSNPIVREALEGRAAELRIARARQEMAKVGATSAFYGEDSFSPPSSSQGAPQRGSRRSSGQMRQRKTQNYPGPPGATDLYSGRYRVMGRREFYIIRAPQTRRYLRYEDIRRQRNRPRLWPRPLGEDPYWER